MLIHKVIKAEIRSSLPLSSGGLIELLELTLGQFSNEFIAPTNRLTQHSQLVNWLCEIQQQQQQQKPNEKQLQQQKKQAEQEQKAWINIDELPVEHEEHMHSINNIFKWVFSYPVHLRMGI